MKIENILLPERKGTYKMVQLDISGEPFIKFDSKSYESEHREILERLLMETGTNFDVDENSAPLMVGDDYRVVGMGQVWYSENFKILNFSDSSLYYEIGVDLNHLKKIKRFLPDYEFRIDNANI